MNLPSPTKIVSVPLERFEEERFEEERSRLPSWSQSPTAIQREPRASGIDRGGSKVWWTVTGRGTSAIPNGPRNLSSPADAWSEKRTSPQRTHPATNA